MLLFRPARARPTAYNAVGTGLRASLRAHSWKYTPLLPARQAPPLHSYSVTPATNSLVYPFVSASGSGGGSPRSLASHRMNAANAAHFA